MEQIKAMIDTLISMEDSFDGYNEDPGFVHASVDWQHSFHVDTDLKDSIEAYMRETKRICSWEIRYDATTQTQYVYAKTNVHKQPPVSK